MQWIRFLSWKKMFCSFIPLSGIFHRFLWVFFWFSFGFSLWRPVVESSSGGRLVAAFASATHCWPETRVAPGGWSSTTWGGTRPKRRMTWRLWLNICAAFWGIKGVCDLLWLFFCVLILKGIGVFDGCVCGCLALLSLCLWMIREHLRWWSFWRRAKRSANFSFMAPVGCGSKPSKPWRWILLT